MIGASDSGPLIIVAIVASVVGPAVMAIITAHMQRISRKQEWDRQDVLDARKEKSDDAREARERGSRGGGADEA